ncbi:MAG: hypothetical protein QOF14_5782 [Hyphomicrobiales bacterium]|jgi:hypothetical protein|nr:hypothetical protein [Bradyrhizobium sp.]MEA2880586.1 hypothetical protein [Hyphomicrobiales bacterium]
MKPVSDPGFITVRLDKLSGRRWGGDVAVEVRDPKTFALRARGIVGEPLNVPAGKHWVSAILPNGEQLSADESVSIGVGEAREVLLNWTDADVPASMETGAWVDRTRRAADILAPAWQLFTRVFAAQIRGNWLAARMGTSPMPERDRVSNLTMDAAFGDLPVLLEVASGNELPTYFAVPIDGEKGRTTSEWQYDDATKQVKIRFDFHDDELNTFFDYVQVGFAQEARSISRRLISQAEEYAEDRKSPLRAVLAAYVLLRANETEGLQAWSRRLSDQYAWLPDGVALRIECLARDGKHREAAELMPELVARGAPWFRSGVAYVAARAKLYSTVRATPSSNFTLAPETHQLIARLAGEMDTLMASLDLNEMISVYRDLPRLT